MALTNIPLVALSIQPFIAILFLIIAIFCWRKSTEGFDKQLKPAALAFSILFVAETLAIGYAWNISSNTYLVQLFAEQGPVWIAALVLEAIGMTVLGFWIWGYIRFRLFEELFIISLAMSLSIFLATTFLFTYFLMRNMEQSALDHLKVDVKVLQYALEGYQSESLAHAKAIANDTTVTQTMAQGDTNTLHTILSEYLISQNTSFIIAATASGQVVMRGEDKENLGNSVYGNPVFDSSMQMQPLSALQIQQTPLAPQIVIEAAAPVKQDNTAIGAILTGFTIDTTFVDGIKEVTGLDATIFANDTRAATTITRPDGSTRNVGTVLTDSRVKESVLSEGEDYIGSTTIFDREYYAAYTPLRTYGNEIIGMLSVLKPQSELFRTAQESLRATFLITILFMALSIIPSYFIARYMQKHLEA